MTWTLNVTGHLHDPVEEAGILARAVDFVKGILDDADIVGAVSYAHFGGTYHTADVLAGAQGDQVEVERPPDLAESAVGEPEKFPDPAEEPDS